jgi:hypothetical protein
MIALEQGDPRVTQMTEMGKAISHARDEILTRLHELDAQNGSAPTPHTLIRELARDKNREPYRAAMMSLIASGIVERSPSWTIRVHSPRTT